MYAHRVYMAGRRSYTRRSCFIPVDYMLKHRVYRDFIENISAKGAFIASKHKPVPGEPVVVVFTVKHSIKSSGQVVRTTEKGFAVEFKKPIAIQ